MVYDFDLKTTDTSLMATVTDSVQPRGREGGPSGDTGARLAPQAKAPLEGVLANVALGNIGADLVAGQGIDQARSAAVARGEGPAWGIAPFAAITGTRSRYQTGSHVDLSGVAFMTGFAKRVETSMMDILAGVFFEAGFARMDTHNSFSSGPSVDGDGRVTGRSAGEATITAITDRGECAACKVTVRKESGNAASKKPALDHTTLNLVIQYNNAHPSQKLQLINTSGSFVYAYQWMSSNPEVATVDPEGLVTAQKPGTTTVTALATNGQALRCAVTVNSDVGKVTLNKRDLLLRTVGSKEALTASVAVEDGTNVPITWVSSNPGVATVDTSGVVTAVADGEAKITALSPDGRFDSCSVFVGLAADKYDTEEDLAEELKLPDPYVAVRMNRLS